MPPFDCQRSGRSSILWAVGRTQASLRQNKRQREFAGFAVKVPGMRVVGDVEGPFALDAIRLPPSNKRTQIRLVPWSPISRFSMEFLRFVHAGNVSL